MRGEDSPFMKRMWAEARAAAAQREDRRLAGDPMLQPRATAKPPTERMPMNKRTLAFVLEVATHVEDIISNRINNHAFTMKAHHGIDVDKEQLREFVLDAVTERQKE